MDLEKLGIFTFVILLIMLLIPIGAISGFSVSGLQIHTQYHYAGWLIFIVVVAVLVMLFLLKFTPVDFKTTKHFFKQLYKAKSEKDKIRDYIEYKLSIGENRLIIRDELSSVGWPEQLINDAFTEAENNYKKQKAKRS